jgi:NAD(P)H-dependent FMN reductase
MSKVLTICGSLRKGSFNRMLADALPASTPGRHDHHGVAVDRDAAL